VEFLRREWARRKAAKEDMVKFDAKVVVEAYRAEVKAKLQAEKDQAATNKAP
jgi:hypothetical protein